MSYNSCPNRIDIQLHLSSHLLPFFGYKLVHPFSQILHPPLLTMPGCKLNSKARSIVENFLYSESPKCATFTVLLALYGCAAVVVMDRNDLLAEIFPLIHVIL